MFNQENFTPDRIFFTQALPVVPVTNIRYACNTPFVRYPIPIPPTPLSQKMRIARRGMLDPSFPIKFC